MGKNSTIKTLGNRIGNVVLHHLLIEHTNIPESIAHLQNEEDEYRNAAIKDSKKYNWNEQDKNLLKEQAIKFIQNKLKNKYLDITFPLEETEKLIDKEIKNLDL